MGNEYIKLLAGGDSFMIVLQMFVISFFFISLYIKVFIQLIIIFWI